MALTHWGFIFKAPGMDPATNRWTTESDGCRTDVVGVADPVDAAAVAADLVAAGVELIELCGAFGPVWTGRIIDAIDGAVPVGAVYYGGEATDQLAELFG